LLAELVHVSSKNTDEDSQKRGEHSSEYAALKGGFLWLAEPMKLVENEATPPYWI
jgi:hypothetical protein